MDERIQRAKRTDPTRAIQEQIRAGTKLPRNTAELLCSIGYEPVVLLMGGPSRPSGDHHCYRTPQHWTYKHNKIRKAEWWTNEELAMLYAMIRVDDNSFYPGGVGRYIQLPPTFSHKENLKLNDSIPQKPARMTITAGEWVFGTSGDNGRFGSNRRHWRQAWTRDLTIPKHDQFLAIALSRCNLMIISRHDSKAPKPGTHLRVVADAIHVLGLKLLSSYELNQRQLRVFDADMTPYGVVDQEAMHRVVTQSNPEFYLDHLYPIKVELLLMMGFEHMGVRPTLDFLSETILKNLGFKV